MRNTILMQVQELMQEDIVEVNDIFHDGSRVQPDDRLIGKEYRFAEVPIFRPVFLRSVGGWL